MSSHRVPGKGIVYHVPGKVIQEAEKRHNGIAGLYVLQGARHLPFGGRPAQKVTKVARVENAFTNTLQHICYFLTH